MYYDTEYAMEVSVIHSQYSDLNRKKNTFSIKELVKILGNKFKQADNDEGRVKRNKRVQDALRLMVSSDTWASFL